MKDGRSIDVGFGSGLGKPRGHRLIEANGGRPGTATNLVRSVDDRITISLLMNSRAEMERISRGVARHFIPSLNLVKPMSGQVDVARLAAFLGAGLAIAAKTLFYDVRGSLVLPTCPVDQFASPIGHADPPLGGRPALQAVPDDRPGFRLIGGYMPDKRAAGAGRHGGLNREHLLSQLSFRGCRQRAD